MLLLFGYLAGVILFFVTGGVATWSGAPVDGLCAVLTGFGFVFAALSRFLSLVSENRSDRVMGPVTNWGLFLIGVGVVAVVMVGGSSSTLSGVLWVVLSGVTVGSVLVRFISGGYRPAPKDPFEGLRGKLDAQEQKFMSMYSDYQ